MLAFIFLTKIDTIIISILVLLLLEAFNALLKKPFTMMQVIVAAIIFITGFISPIAWFTAQVSLMPFALIHTIITLILAVAYVYRSLKQQNNC